MATVICHKGSLSGETLTLRLYQLGSGTEVNSGGDSATESGTGVFSATVAESLSGIHWAEYSDGLGEVVHDGWVNMSLDPAYVGSPTQVGFGSASQATLDGIATAASTLTTRIPGVVQPQTGDSYAKLGTPTGASIASDINLVGLAVDGVQDDVDTLLSRITSTLFNGITSLANWLRAMTRADASVDDTALTEINAGVGSYDNSVYSLGAGTPVEVGDEINVNVTEFSASALQQLANQNITIQQPLGYNGAITTTRGMDYNTATNRAIYWTDTSNVWPTLTDASITVYAWARGGYGRAVKSFSGDVVSATGANKKIRLELTDTETAGMKAGDWTYGVKAVLTSGDIVDLIKPTNVWHVLEFPE